MNEQVKQVGLEEAEVESEMVSVDVHRVADVLLGSIEYFCMFHDLPFSSARALRGVARTGDALLPSAYEQACENVGLLSRKSKTRPSSVSEMTFPFLVFFPDNVVGIVEKKDPSGLFQVLLFDNSGDKSLRKFKASELDRHALDVVQYVTKMPEPSKIEDRFASRDNHWFWSAVRRFWPSWSYVILATFVINLLGLALPLFVMNVYDRVIPNNSFPTLWALAAGVSIALVFDFLLKIMRSAMIDNSSKRIDLGVSANIFEHAMDVKMEHRNTRSGEIANNIRDFESVREFFSSGAITALVDLLFIGVFLSFLWFIVGDLALVPLIAVPVVLAVTLFVQIPLRKAVRDSQTQSGSRHSVLVEALVGAEAVKTVGAESTLQRQWESSVAGAARAGASTRFWSNLAVYFTMFAQQAVSVLVIIWGVFLVADGAITIGALIAANILAGRILSPLGGIASTLVRAQQAFSALGNLNKLMKLDRDNPKSRGSGLTVLEGGVEFRNVAFTYPGQVAPALNGVSLSISPGERVGIIGKVGSGKSTLGRLLSGLYHPLDGGVMVDGLDTRHIATADLRDNSVYVGQETDLFSGTLRDNLLISGNRNENEIKVALETSGVGGFASRHPLGLQMPVGERGRNLSGGQRQAVGIARAMLIKPKILFLDEPTAQMDTVTEAAFAKGLGRWITPEHTLLISTHRNTLLDLVDRLIVLDEGKIVHDGPKAQVLKSISGNKQKTSARSGGRK